MASLRDIIRRRKKRREDKRKVVPDVSSKLGLPAPKETPLTKIFKKPTPTPTPTQGFSSRDTGFSSRGGTSTSKRSSAEKAAQVLKEAAAKKAAEQKAKQAAAKKAAEEAKRRKIQEEVKRNQERQRQEELRKELARIERQRQLIIKQGGRTKTRTSRDAKTGDRLEIKTTSVDKIVKGKKIKQRIFEVTNLDTGKKTVKTFERDPKSKRTFQSGGVILEKPEPVKKKEKPAPVKEEKGLIATLERFSEKRIKKRQEATIALNKAEKDFKIKLEQAKRGEIDPSEVQKAAKERMSTVAKSFGAKGLEQISNSALGLALLSKVPGLLKSAEGRKELAKNVKNLPGEVIKDLKKFGALYKSNPEQAAAVVGVSYFEFLTGEKILKVGGKVGGKTLNKIANLNPALLKVEKGIIKVSKKQKGLVLKVGGLKEVEESLARQLVRGGKKVTAVSAQANKLVGFIKRKNVIRKPLPFDEKKLTIKTRDLLKRFDKGKLESNQVLLLNQRLRFESKKLAGGQKKGVDLLERSTYFDPDRVLRKSRLGELGAAAAKEEGDFFDLITGRASLFQKKAKPQILVLEDFVEQLPKTKEFKTIIAKLKKSTKAGKDPNLTKLELAQLSRFQVTPSGKLKPIGSTTFQGGLEREVTVAPGEVIKRVKKLGTLKIGEKRIPIVAVKIIKDKKGIKLIKSIQKITDDLKLLKTKKSKLKTKKSKDLVEKEIKKQTEKLDKIKKKSATKEVKEFLKETRRRRPSKIKKRFPARRKLTTAAVRRAAKRRPTPRKKPRKAPRKPTPRKARVTPRKTPRKARVTPRKAPRPTPRKAPRKVKRPVRIPKRKPTKKTKAIILPKRKKKLVRKKKKIEKGYNVLARPVKKRKGQKKPKLVKINKVPLKKRKAEDLRNYIADTSLARTARIKKTKLKPKNGKLRIPAGYAKKTKKKFRNYKIVKGKRKPLPKGKVIERRGKLLDTRQEKKKITVRGRLRQLEKPLKRKKVVKKRAPVKRKTPIKRKVSKKIVRKVVSTRVRTSPRKVKVQTIKTKRVPIKKRRSKK